MDKILESTQNKIIELEETRRQQKYSIFLNEIAEQTKSEFIAGEVIIHSPASLIHIDANISLTTMLKLHVEKYKLGWLASEKALVKMKKSDNDFEPDICFFSKEKSNTFNSKTCQFPPPDLAIEIVSKSSKKRDREIKFRDYARHNVAEYWIIEPNNREIEQYYLEKQGKYILAKKWHEAEIITSIEIKNLKIPIDAIFFYDALDEYLFGEYRKNIKDIENKIIKEQISSKEKDLRLQEKDVKLKENELKLKENDLKLKEKDYIIKQLKKQLKSKL